MSVVFDKEWHELPRPAAGAKLVEIRNELRAKNLHDTEEPPLEASEGPISPEVRATRTNDGTYNDLSCPRMGSAGTRFGRNVPLSETFPDTANLLTPNPRTVSLELLTRTTFQPAEILSVLGAAWIQFQVHDWFMHKKGVWTNTHDIPVAAGDAWHERPMRVPRTPAETPEGPRLDAPAGLRERELALVGRVAGLRLHHRRSRRRCAPGATARSSSARTAVSVSIRSRASKSPGSRRTPGSARACCTASSRSSTTRSATG